MTEEILRRRRARNRWFVGVTLMRNRQLSVQRQPILPELEAIRTESRVSYSETCQRMFVLFRNTLNVMSIGGQDIVGTSFEKGQILGSTFTHN